MFLIYFGFAQLFASSLTQKIIGFIGGLIMIYAGFRMIKTEKKTVEEYEESRHSTLIAGIITTGANPYFLLWWATIGTVLIMNAMVFGFAGFLVFAIIHWLCDFLWNTLVCLIVFKSRHFLTKKVYDIIFGFCFAVLMGFGAWFIMSALL